jgi:hypothetical protein
MLFNGMEEMRRAIGFHPGCISGTSRRGIRSRYVRWSWSGKGAADHVCLAGAAPKWVVRRPADRVALALHEEKDIALFSVAKKGRCPLFALLVIMALLVATCLGGPLTYPWQHQADESQSLLGRIPVPEGYRRVETLPGTFEDWLRHLPLKEGRPPIHLHDGRLKGNQHAHHAVVDIDVGSLDLQQCADAVIRLRAEYLYSVSKYDEIRFSFTSGDVAHYRDWILGYRPAVTGNNVSWTRSGQTDSSYAGFRQYLDTVFTYAGSYSLSRELVGVPDPAHMQTGDVFIEGGFPGHAVMVVDMAVDRRTGRKLFLLAQSYMPAQEMHILRNPGNPELSPWYPIDFGDILTTPEWPFSRADLRRWSAINPWIRVDEGLFVAEFASPVRSQVGDSKIVVMRISPDHFAFKLLCASEHDNRRMILKEWCRRHNLLAAVNAGMFQADGVTHVGYMKNFNHVNNSYLRDDYKAVFAFNPVDSALPEVQIIDRQYQSLDELAPRYQTLIQNLRMVSARRENVWSQQNKAWSMVVLGTDSKGNILFIFTRSPYSVHDFINILLSLPISLYNAMYLEGGPEASLYMSTNGYEIERFGSYETDFRDDDTNTIAWPIPNIIGIIRRP